MVQRILYMRDRSISLSDFLVQLLFKFKNLCDSLLHAGIGLPDSPLRLPIRACGCGVSFAAEASSFGFQGHGAIQQLLDLSHPLLRLQLVALLRGASCARALHNAGALREGAFSVFTKSLVRPHEMCTIEAQCMPFPLHAHQQFVLGTFKFLHQLFPSIDMLGKRLTYLDKSSVFTLQGVLEMILHKFLAWSLVPELQSLLGNTEMRQLRVARAMQVGHAEAHLSNQTLQGVNAFHEKPTKMLSCSNSPHHLILHWISSTRHRESALRDLG
mmetsp:Transcript_71038/g.134280  ORF Transcript_71038/g.134280 Transcript_71038/m.134280 type:complete len:271 (-) Transcript_71038:781-1593(-)